MLLTVNVVLLIFFEIEPLVMLQLPLAPVVQRTSVPPAVKLPLAIAPDCKLPPLSLTVMMTVAFQLPLRKAVVLPLKLAMETEMAGVVGPGLVSLVSSE